jgi:hypothetical protein
MEFKIGDKVRCSAPGSWAHNKVGKILRLDVISSDNTQGHMLQMDRCVTVMEPEYLTKVEDE